MRVKVDDTIFRRSTMPTTPAKKQARQIINWFLNPNKFASHGLVFDRVPLQSKLETSKGYIKII